MTDYVYVNGQRLRLVKTLGTGGEGQVFEDETGQAVKVFTDKASPSVTRLRQRKIQAASNTPQIRKPNKFDVYKPDALSTDDNGMFNGYQMRKFPPGIVMMGDLSTTDTWEAYRVNQASVIHVFRNLHDMLTTLHLTRVDPTKPLSPENCVVIGDLSGVNVGFNAQTGDYMVIGCDVDSWQFGAQAPCIIATLDFLTPRLYDVDDLSTMQHPFLPEDDWWAYTINLFNSLFRFAAFRKPQPNTMTPDLVRAGQHMLAPGAKHPSLRRIALPLKSMPDRLLEVFLDIFNDKRVDGPFPLDVLEWTLEHFEECHNHQPIFYVFARERGDCPHCARDAEIPDLTQIEIDIGMKIVEILALANNRRILFTKSIIDGRRQRLFILDTDTSGQMHCVWMEAAGITKEVTVPIAYQPGMTFDVNNQYLLVTESNGTAHLFNIAVREVFATNSAGKAPPIVDFPVGTYTNRPVVALGEGTPSWLLGNTMEKGEIIHRQMFSETIMNMTSPITTWFTAFSHTDDNIVVGFEDVIVRDESGSAESYTQWFAIIKGQFHQLNLPRSRGTTLVDWRVVADRNSFAIVRLLQESGGSPLVDVDVYENAKPLFRMPGFATGQRLQGEGVLLNRRFAYPTEDGILMMDGKKDPYILQGTETVSPASRLCGLLREPDPAKGTIHSIDATRGDLFLTDRNRLFKVVPISK